MEICGQNPGAEEEAQGVPYVGKTGQEMDRVYLPLAGLVRDEINITNALRCRWNHGNTLPPITEVIAKQALKHCRVHDRSQSRIVITQGDYALLAHTGEHSSTEWRGWALPPVGRGSINPGAGIWTPLPTDPIVYATVHLARLYREPELVLTTKMDWAKIPRVVADAWPRRLENLTNILHTSPSAWPRAFSFDTEFWRGEGHTRLVRYSMTEDCGSYGLLTRVVEKVDHTVPLLGGFSGRKVICQNGPVDYYHLADLAGTEDASWATIEDTMYLHAVLYPGKVSDPMAKGKRGSGVGHDLDYLGSLYAPTNRWKHLDEAAPLEYSAADALNTWFVWQALMREAQRDPLSLKVYQEQKRPLVPIIARAQRQGLRTWPPRVQEVSAELEGQVAHATLKAQAAAGWPLNVGSNQQAGHQVYAMEGITVPRKGKRG